MQGSCASKEEEFVGTFVICIFKKNYISIYNG
jgi:hypothetical protein